MDDEMKKAIQETVKEAVKEAMEDQQTPQPKKTTFQELASELAQRTVGYMLTAGVALVIPMLMTKLSQKDSIKPPHFDKEWKPEYIEVDETEEKKNDGSF